MFLCYGFLKPTVLNIVIFLFKSVFFLRNKKLWKILKLITSYSYSYTKRHIPEISVESQNWGKLIMQFLIVICPLICCFKFLCKRNAKMTGEISDICCVVADEKDLHWQRFMISPVLVNATKCALQHILYGSSAGCFAAFTLKMP